MTGSVMVEMAGAITLLVFLVFGITELGRALYQLNMINKAVTSGARYLARSPDIVGAPDDTPPCASQGSWTDALTRAQNIVIYGNESATGTAVLKDATVLIDDPVLRAYQVDGDTMYDCVLVVHAEAPFTSLFGGDIYLPLFGGEGEDGLVLRGTAEERYLRIYYAPAP